MNLENWILIFSKFQFIIFETYNWLSDFSGLQNSED